MSSAQTQILSAIETRLNSVVSTYKRLKFSYDLEANDLRASSKSYGVGVNAGSSIEATHQSITMDQRFFVVLARGFSKRQNDDGERTALNLLLDDMENVYRDLFQSKIGIPSVVYLVSDLEMDEPEKIGDNVLSLRISFNVRHRKATT